MEDEARREAEKRMAEGMERRVAEGVERGVTVGTAIFVAVAVTFVMSLVVFKFVWAWVVPDLFPGAVAQGLISANLSWFATLKLAVLVAVLSGFGPALDEAFQVRP